MYWEKVRWKTRVLFVDGGSIAEENDSSEALRSLWSLLMFRNRRVSIH